ncbi:ATP12 family chaperone protein [Antarctobacter heliothermus]|uniref:Chaperone required for the assembly of the F1-ATPase n=1 Tax=Antarctobacter heliothermus TaxID=74033 RepID=A0A239CBR5_9RHOB|nr:ATP12 family protein [Antarctobacter heliothermus]SNS17071.1 Chaperone required for the assembly of the F1-ATPase [Antarctobacter heliothermus]
MSEWAPKRFWQNAEVAQADLGYAVTLDGRGVKTPAKTPLVVPTEALAREIAAEWEAQQDRVNPATMPFTRMANSALDKVAPQHAAVADMLAAYGDSDLLCYRAGSPASLVDRQKAGWDPLLDWAEAAYGARLMPVVGVMHRPQDPGALARLTAQVHGQSAFALAAFHDLVSMSGSLVLALAVIRGERDPAAAWALSRIDETWQEEQWGVDEDAAALAQRKSGEFQHAAVFHSMSEG